MRWWPWRKAKGGYTNAESAVHTPAGRVHAAEYYVPNAKVAEQVRQLAEAHGSEPSGIFYWNPTKMNPFSDELGGWERWW